MKESDFAKKKDKTQVSPNTKEGSKSLPIIIEEEKSEQSSVILWNIAEVPLLNYFFNRYQKIFGKSKRDIA